MTKIANVLRLVLLIAHGALSATADPKQPSVHQRDTIDNNAVNLTLPDNFDFTVDGDRYIVNNFQPPYTPIFEFYRFLIVCMNNVLLDVTELVPIEGVVEGKVWKSDVADTGLTFRIELDYWATEGDAFFLYNDIGYFLRTLALDLMPKFEDQAWVPLFTAKIEDIWWGRIAKGFTMTITPMQGNLTTGKSGGGTPVS